MYKEINSIVQHLFQKENHENVGLNDIETLLSEYPYIAPARYLAAQKKYNTDPDTLHEEMVTAGLYINNPLWLQWLLTNEETAPANQIAGENLSSSFASQNQPFAASGKNLPAPDQQQNPEAALSAADVHEVESLSVDEPHEDHTPSITSENLTIPDQQLDQLEEQPPEDVLSAEDPNEGQFSEKTHKDLVPDITDEGRSVDKADKQDDEPQNDRRSGIEQEVSFRKTPGPEEEIKTPAITKTGVFSGKDSPIIFQSYHTIDYFASQGIRLQQAEFSKDKLGQQLKSFTEWLRSMKKLPSTETEQPGAPEDTTRQESVIQSAASSVEEKEVFTEAMAEVWAKQGNIEKAKAIYNKLSLQNPAKSAYFAAKTDQLKAV